MRLALAPDIDKASVLSEALSNAGKQLGMTQADLGGVIGKDRTTISRGGIDFDRKAGKLVLLFIRCYRALYVLVGGDARQMRHWMQTENLHTAGVPAEQITSIQGLARVLEYLDVMRGEL